MHLSPHRRRSLTANQNVGLGYDFLFGTSICQFDPMFSFCPKNFERKYNRSNRNAQQTSAFDNTIEYLISERLDRYDVKLCMIVFVAFREVSEANHTAKWFSGRKPNLG